VYSAFLFLFVCFLFDILQAVNLFVVLLLFAPDHLRAMHILTNIVFTIYNYYRDSRPQESHAVKWHLFEGRYPHSVVWDAEEPKLLAVETIRFMKSSHASKSSAASKFMSEAISNFPGRSTTSGGVVDLKRKDEESKVGGLTGPKDKSRQEVSTLFVCPDYPVLLRDTFAVDKSSEGLVGLNVPHLYLGRVTDTNKGGVESKVFRDAICNL
jgi:hypothetical protein